LQRARRACVLLLAVALSSTFAACQTTKTVVIHERGGSSGHGSGGGGEGGGGGGGGDSQRRNTTAPADHAAAAQAPASPVTAQARNKDHHPAKNPTAANNANAAPGKTDHAGTPDDWGTNPAAGNGLAGKPAAPTLQILPDDGPQPRAIVAVGAPALDVGPTTAPAPRGTATSPTMNPGLAANSAARGANHPALQIANQVSTFKDPPAVAPSPTIAVGVTPPGNKPAPAPRFSLESLLPPVATNTPAPALGQRVPLTTATANARPAAPSLGPLTVPGNSAADPRTPAPAITMPAGSQNAATAPQAAATPIVPGIGNAQTAPGQTRREALDILAHTPATHVAIWFRGQSAPLILTRDLASARIQTAADHRLILLPLPGDTPTQWQPTLQHTTDVLRTMQWLAEPADAGLPTPEQTAAQQAAERGARENLRRAFYQMLLGDPAATKPAH